LLPELSRASPRLPRMRSVSVPAKEIVKVVDIVAGADPFPVLGFNLRRVWLPHHTGHRELRPVGPHCPACRELRTEACRCVLVLGQFDHVVTRLNLRPKSSVRIRIAHCAPVYALFRAGRGSRNFKHRRHGRQEYGDPFLLAFLNAL